jgi:hypothetical protein
MWRDTNDQIWTRNPTDGAGYYRGTAPRAFHRERGIDAGANVNRKPCTVYKASTNEIWHFAIGHSTTSTVRLTITDSVTGAIKVPTVTHSLMDNVYACSAVVDNGGVVRFFWSNGGATLYHAHFTAAGAFNGQNSYVSLAGRVWTTVDAHLLTAGTHSGSVVVYADRFSTSAGTDTFGHHVSKLNTGTGLPSASVEVTGTQADTFNTVTEGGTLFGSGSGDVVYVGAYKPNNAADNSILLVLHAINTGTLVASTVTLATISYTPAGAGNHPILGVATGYVAANGDRVVYGSWIEGDDVVISGQGFTGDLKTNKSSVTRYTYNGSTTTKVISLGAWLASKPFTVSGKFYFMTGFDDGYTNRLQRGYFLRDSNGVIMDSIGAGRGSSMYHGGGFQGDLSARDDGYSFQITTTHTVSVHPVGTKAISTVLYEGLAYSYTIPTVIEFDFAATYYSSARNTISGGLPMFASENDIAREASPIHSPHRDLTFTNGGGALIGTVRFAIVFAMIDSRGNITRSSPRVKDLVFNSGHSNLTLAHYHHAQGPAWIEIYWSGIGAADMYLQRVIANSVLTETTTLVFSAGSTPTLTGELLYTTGDALDNGPTPPCRVLVQHKGRQFAFGTPGGQIFFTHVKKAGRDYEWNAILSIDWADRSGDKWWACQVSPEILAFGDGVKIGIISGGGPNDNGEGAFTVTTMNDDKTPDHPALVVRGPLGAYFLKKGDNRPCVLTASGVTEIGQGFDRFRSFTFVGARYIESTSGTKGEVIFIGKSGGLGKMCVLDCDRPIAEQPAGSWTLHENTNLPEWIGANIVGGVLSYLEGGTSGVARLWTQGTSFFDNSSSSLAVLKKWRTGKYQLAGFLGEFGIDWVHMSCSLNSATADYQHTIFNDQGTAEVHTDSHSTTSDLGFRSAHERTRWIEILTEETAAGASPTGEGRLWNGVAIEFKPYGRAANHRRTVA